MFIIHIYISTYICSLHLCNQTQFNVIGFNNPLPGNTGKTDACKNDPSSIKNENKIENVPAKKVKLEESPFGDIVLVERPGDLPQTILACAVNVSGGNIEWKINKTNMNKW